MFFYSLWLCYFFVLFKIFIYCVDFLIIFSCFFFFVYFGIKVCYIFLKMWKLRKGENNFIFVVIIKMLVYDCNNWNYVKGKYLINEIDCFFYKMLMNYVLFW